MPVDIDCYFAKRDMALRAIERMKDSEDTEAIDHLWWEVALLRFSPVASNGGCYMGDSYEVFAVKFGLTPETVRFADTRAVETRDIALKLHYLGFVLDRMPPTGRAWVDRMREMLLSWRQYADECRMAAATNPTGHAAMCVERALKAIGAITSRPGVLRDMEPTEWAGWVLQLAHDVRDFPGDESDESDFWYHRWVAPFLRTLTSLPATASPPPLRHQAFALLEAAAAYYEASPLADHFALLVADVRYELRTHWGETDAHKDKVREQFAALMRRADLHKTTGNGMLTQHFVREALRLAEEHRQYFTAAQVDDLMREERAAIEHAIRAGEFKEVSVSMEFPREYVERLRATPEETMSDLIAEVAIPVPTTGLREAAAKGETPPLYLLFPATVVGGGKVVGESPGEEKNLQLEGERNALFLAALAGQAMTTTIVSAASRIGLTTEHLITPLTPLALDDGTIGLIRHGCERMIAKDFISACHILVPRVEDVLRQHLRSRGLPATEFKRDVGDGTSRTDDESVGAMLRGCLPNGITVRAYLGDEFTQHIERTMLSQTGLTLRHSFAHGLAKPEHCTPDNAGIVLAILYKLAAIASS